MGHRRQMPRPGALGWIGRAGVVLALCAASALLGCAPAPPMLPPGTPLAAPSLTAAKPAIATAAPPATATSVPPTAVASPTTMSTAAGGTGNRRAVSITIMHTNDVFGETVPCG